MSDLIKYGPDVFKIYVLVSFNSISADLGLRFSALILIVLYFIKCPFFCDRLFFINIYDTKILIIMYWKLIDIW